MRVQGEPTLKFFSDEIGQRIRDMVFLFIPGISLVILGSPRVSRSTRHNEWRAPSLSSSQEIYKHGRWEALKTHKTDDIPARYDQWDAVDHVAITLCCM
jgi:hypothetical protein